MVWHGDSEIPASDLIVLPGGFSYGDYLRSGAMAAHSPVMREVVARARSGTPVLGICNGFQVLTESGLLPGALMRNATLKFICKDVWLRVERNDTAYARRYAKGEVVVPHRAQGRQAISPTRRRSRGSKAKAASPSATATRTARSRPTPTLTARAGTSRAFTTRPELCSG
jgi:phosphoribosylformylglycinamidine synthase I